MGTEERIIKPLHNFTLPGDLRWGNTRHLRCMKLQQRSTSPCKVVNDSINLRTRRPVFKTTKNDSKFDSVITNTKSNGEDVKKRDKFSVSLSKKELEEDFAVFGQRLHRRPKKRLRLVQKQLDTLFPGLWLREVTADMYKVVEAAP